MAVKALARRSPNCAAKQNTGLAVTLPVAQCAGNVAWCPQAL